MGKYPKGGKGKANRVILESELANSNNVYLQTLKAMTDNKNEVWIKLEKLKTITF